MSKDGWIRYQPILDAVNHLVTERSRTVIVVFLVLTIGFSLGFPYITLDPGEEGFTEDTPEMEAMETVNEEFEQPLVPEEGSTQLIQRGENVASKDGILRMLRLKKHIEDDPELRVVETSSPADGFVQALDQSAETRDEQIRAVEGATEAEVRQAVRLAVHEEPSLTESLSDDFNSETAYASAQIGIVEHEFPEGDDEEFEAIQFKVAAIGDSVGGDVIVFGSAIFEAEFDRALEDGLSMMIPAVMILILIFLLFAYRDPIDMSLGLLALCMALVWTFGLVGHLRIPFNQIMTAIPPLMLALGIDFGIHSVNRYREERVKGKGIGDGMRAANNQLLVAFFIVTGTTVIGFGANMASDLPPLQDFGFVAAVGVIFTFLIFGIFMPATKIYLDELRDGSWIPEFGTRPLGEAGSSLGKVLPVGAIVANKAPALMLCLLLIGTVGAGFVATDIDTQFDDEDFLPYEELPPHLELVPEPLAPEDYQIRSIVNFLGDNFESGEDDEITVYIEGPLYESYVLESVHRAGQEPPSTIVTADNHAVSDSVLDVIDLLADEDDEFATLVERSDSNNNGVPDRNLERIYTELFESEFEAEARQYITEDMQSMRVIYSVDAQATQEEVTPDARELADRHRLDATATGTIIVFQTVTDLLFESALVSMGIALGLTGIYFVFIYGILEGRPTLGIANLVPIISTVAFLGMTMVVLDIPFNALTATALSITIGIGVDYSVHITHRFIDEYNMGKDAYPALVLTLQGAGGGITGSMITTVGGVGSLTLAVTPMLGEFGVLMAISVILSYLASIIVLPPTLLIWERLFGDERPAVGPSGRDEITKQATDD